MSEQKQRLAKALRTQAQAIALIIEASEHLDRTYEEAFRLFQQATRELAAMSKEVNESPITQATLASHSFLEELQVLQEVSKNLLALLPPARNLQAVLTEMAEQKEAEA